MFNLKKENTKVEIELTIDGAEWEKGVQKIYESSKSKFNVEGFRKGKAPRKVIEKTYGSNVFFEDTVEYFVNETLNEVISKNPELEPVAMPTTRFESSKPSFANEAESVSVATLENSSKFEAISRAEIFDSAIVSEIDETMILFK